jgi:hypothetical protein
MQQRASLTRTLIALHILLWKRQEFVSKPGADIPNISYTTKSLLRFWKCLLSKIM